MYKKIIIVLISSMFFFSCEKEKNVGIDEQLQPLQNNSISFVPKPKSNPTNFVFVNDNDIYYVSSWNSDAKRLTNSSSSLKYKVRLSPDHQYIAYLNSNRSPVIISVSTGDVVKSSTSYTNSSDLQWSKDSKTLVFLNSSKFYYLDLPGGNYRVPSINYANYITDESKTIWSFDIDASGGIVYNFTYRSSLYNYTFVSFRDFFSTTERILYNEYAYYTNYFPIFTINIFGATNQLFYLSNNVSDKYIIKYTHDSGYYFSNRFTSIIDYSLNSYYYTSVTDSYNATDSYGYNSIEKSVMSIIRSNGEYGYRHVIRLVEGVDTDFEYQSDKYKNVTALHWEP